MARRQSRSTGGASGQSSRAFESTTPAQLRIRLRREREQMVEVQERLGTLLDRMDDIRTELAQRDDSHLKKWYITAAVCAIIGLIAMIIPGLLLTVIGIGFVIGALCSCGRYLSERSHCEKYFNRLVTRLNEYAAQEKRFSNQIETHEQNIRKIERLLGI